MPAFLAVSRVDLSAFIDATDKNDEKLFFILSFSGLGPVLSFGRERFLHHRSRHTDSRLVD